MALSALPGAEQHGRELLLSHPDPALAGDGPPAPLCRRHAPSHAATAHCTRAAKDNPALCSLDTAWAPGWACLRIVQCMQVCEESTMVLSFRLKNDSMHAVTFLALGNGAPDISASIAAISSGNYELALGALLGMSPTKFTVHATIPCRTRGNCSAGGRTVLDKLHEAALPSSASAG